MDTFLSYAISALAVINGLMLLRHYLRDKPILKVEPVHPDTYQWFFTLPNGTYDNKPKRKTGFLAYIDIKNTGIRDVSLAEWRLIIKSSNGVSRELSPISIPEPSAELEKSKHTKQWPVLGQKGLVYSGDTMIKAGGSIAGFAYYVFECYGSDDWNPSRINDRIPGLIQVSGVYGNKARSTIHFKEVTLEYVNKMIPNIDKIYP